MDSAFLYGAMKPGGGVLLASLLAVGGAVAIGLAIGLAVGVARSRRRADRPQAPGRPLPDPHSRIADRLG